ncbi:Retrovirus-related Pol polyprotein from transposon RE1 [Cardamine amara subsp. amara]|uniref:Retrovirus-related Pol polyprotein from transposon RE1 n=1 Tax=Cardamine amara subsp. amara TaxID=228776 RepID=A0ABD1BYM2_CARAN
MYPLRRKSQVAETFIKFKNLVENKFQHRIVNFHFDNGGEFMVMASYLANQGISHYTTPPHTPELTGISERKHRHIVETGLSLLSHASLSIDFWTYAFSTAVYLINRLPSSVLQFHTPYELLFHLRPNHLKLRIFGCLCCPWLRPYNSNKLQARSTPCIFLGYSPTQSGYFCYDHENARLYVSRHVQFHETIFPFQTQQNLAPSLSDFGFQHQILQLLQLFQACHPYCPHRRCLRAQHRHLSHHRKGDHALMMLEIRIKSRQTLMGQVQISCPIPLCLQAQMKVKVIGLILKPITQILKKRQLMLVGLDLILLFLRSKFPNRLLQIHNLSPMEVMISAQNHQAHRRHLLPYLRHQIRLRPQPHHRLLLLKIVTIWSHGSKTTL